MYERTHVREDTCMRGHMYERTYVREDTCMSILFKDVMEGMVIR